MNTISANRLSPLRSLDKICTLINQAKNKEKNLDNALGLIGHTIGARAVAIHKKEYIDQDWEATYPEFRRQEGKVFPLAYCPALPGRGTFPLFWKKPAGFTIRPQFSMA